MLAVNQSGASIFNIQFLQTLTTQIQETFCKSAARLSWCLLWGCGLFFNERF